MLEYIKEHNLQFLLEKKYDLDYRNPYAQKVPLAITTCDVIYRKQIKILKYCWEKSLEYSSARVDLLLNDTEYTYKIRYPRKEEIVRSLDITPTLCQKICDYIYDNAKCLDFLYQFHHDAMVITHHKHYYLLYDCLMHDHYCLTEKDKVALSYTGKATRDDGKRGTFYLEEISESSKSDDWRTVKLHSFKRIIDNRFIFSSDDIYTGLSSKYSVEVNGHNVREYGILPLRKKKIDS